MTTVTQQEYTVGLHRKQDCWPAEAVALLGLFLGCLAGFIVLLPFGLLAILVGGVCEVLGICQPEVTESVPRIRSDSEW